MNIKEGLNDNQIISVAIPSLYCNKCKAHNSIYPSLEKLSFAERPLTQGMKAPVKVGWLNIRNWWYRMAGINIYQGQC